MGKDRRGRSTAAKPPKAQTAANRLPLSLPGVYLLTAESDGHEAVGGLTLLLDDDGLTVVAPHGTTAAQLRWSEPTILETTGRTEAPGGVEAVGLAAVGPYRSHRFLVPTEDPVALETAIAAFTGGPPRRPKKKRKRK